MEILWAGCDISRRDREDDIVGMNKEPGGKYCDQLCGETRRGKGGGAL